MARRASTAITLTPEPKEQAAPSKHEQKQILAFLLWEKATGGVPVDDEKTKQFWLEAEKELDSTES